MEDKKRLNGIDRLARIDEKLDRLIDDAQETRKGIMKLVYAVLGILAATIGVKFIGTPMIVHISCYLALFAGTFLLFSAIGQWKALNWRRNLIRLGFVGMLYFHVGMRIVIEHTSLTAMPFWGTAVVNVFFILLSIGLVFSACRPHDKASVPPPIKAIVTKLANNKGS